MAPMVSKFVRGNVRRAKVAGRYIRTTRTPALGETGDMHSGLTPPMNVRAFPRDSLELGTSSTCGTKIARRYHKCNMCLLDYS